MSTPTSSTPTSTPSVQPAARAWRPILEGPSAARAGAALQAILADLRSAALDPGLGGSLAGGAAGAALLYAYLERARPGQGWGEAFQGALDVAVERLGGSVMSPGLYSGFTGIAWLMDHLAALDPASGSEDPNTDIDAALLDYLDQAPWMADYDLIGGLAGYGLYALQRLERPGGRAILAKVLAHLYALEVPRDGGGTWYTAPHLLPPWQRELHPEGYYNLGLAHGVPAVLVLLARALRAGHGPAREPLERGVAWLLAQRLPAEAGGCFPTAVSHGAQGPEPGPSRVAWCYGDLGLGTALLAAARAAGRPDWEIHALDILRAAARLPRERAGVRDGGLCHGAAGNAHLFNRLHQATGEPLFREAALAYFDLLFELRKEGRGIGGFEAWMPMTHTPDEDPWKPVPGFLEGGIGIALALVAALHAQEPAWDAFLMVDVPPTPAAAR